MTHFDRKTFFDAVRADPFSGTLKQSQVDGMEAILTEWEVAPISDDLRHLAYMLATTYHETAATMRPIEEYGKGSGQSYGQPDPETGQTYYGRGYVQLTWRDNYARADRELGLVGARSLEWHAENALDPVIAADVMFHGMAEGWFRGDSQGRQTLARYFNASTDDPVNARDIINGDISKNGPMIAGYHTAFLGALTAAAKEGADVDPAPLPEPSFPVVNVALEAPEGVAVAITVNGETILAGPGQ